ncbi:NAD-dependent epimerase/dehydratase family protein [Vibrio sp.]|uniref:NAD-dependent epimerase/dehydratase family protein n=1 Tax=Vibrio sp. TaxID=678 RepID=UPI00311E6E10
MKDILIIGGGWLGKPLAHYLQTIGHSVTVSRTTEVGVTEINSLQLTGVLLDLKNDVNTITDSIKKVQPHLVIGCFPPGFRSGESKKYTQCWDKLVKACQSAHVEKVIMVSSTGVYPDLAKPMDEDDASLSIASHSSDFAPKSKVMLQAEQHVIDSGIKYAIIRCSGLVGPERHPSRFVGKMRQVSSSAPANMLHLTDAIGVISFMVPLSSNAVVNATTPNTVSKAEFYQAALDSVQSKDRLPPIVHQDDKRITSAHIEELGYKFHYKHTLELV